MSQSKPEQMEYAALLEHCQHRLSGLRQERYSWWRHCKEIADYIFPAKHQWLISPNKSDRGSPVNYKIFDNTATRAHRVQASGMMAGITSPGRPWFRLTIDDLDLAEQEDVKRWLTIVRDRLLTVYGESNFYNALASMYEDIGVFAAAPMIIYEDFEDVIRCYVPSCGEYFLGNSDRQFVDTLYREFVLTVYQIVQKFGIDNVSSDVKQAIDNGNLSQEKVIGHAIEANEDFIEKAKGLTGMPYREIYWELASGSGQPPLRVRGFHECPFIAPRWSISGNSAYGSGSPGMDALADVKQLQVMTKRKAQALDKHVTPPMIADASLKNEPNSLLPGGITYVPSMQGGIGMKPVYQIAPDFSGLVEDIREVQKRIQNTFYNDLFMMISQLDSVRTATEIDARREEKLIQLGPVLERFEDEALNPIIDRTFNIMLRANLLPPPPQALHGQHIKCEYVSMLAQSQKAAQTAGIERLAGFVGNLAAAKPDALDTIDVDKMIELYNDLLGNDPDLTTDKDALVKIRMARAKQMQAQQQQEQMSQMAQSGQAAAAGAKTLSETQTGGGISALQMMLGGGAA